MRQSCKCKWRLRTGHMSGRDAQAMEKYFSRKVIDQSSPRHELVDNGGCTNFKPLQVKQNARAMAEILGSLSYKVCSTPSPKSVILEPSLCILRKSTIFSWWLVAISWWHQILVYTCRISEINRDLMQQHAIKKDAAVKLLKSSQPGLTFLEIESFLLNHPPSNSYTCFARPIGYRQRWQAPDVPAKLAKRVICTCIREICFFRFSVGPKSHKFSTSILTRHLHTRQLVTELSERADFITAQQRQGFADKETLVISCVLISAAYEHLKFQTEQWQLECATFSILTLTYGFQVSQPKTLMVGICGFCLTVFWGASCEDSICCRAGEKNFTSWKKYNDKISGLWA